MAYDIVFGQTTANYTQNTSLTDSNNPVSVSADGRWLAVGAFHEKDVRIFDLDSSSVEAAHVVATGAGSYPAFSPDGKWLACSGTNENRVLRAGTWELEHCRPRRSSALMGYISFSSDSRLMSVVDRPDWPRCTRWRSIWFSARENMPR